MRATFTRGAKPGAEHYYDPMRGFAFLSPKRSWFDWMREFRQSSFELGEELRYSRFEFATDQREDDYEQRVFGARYRRGPLFESHSYLEWARKAFAENEASHE